MSTFPSSAVAGSIRLSSAASMVCCHVLVEFGITKPNWKYHSADGSARRTGWSRHREYSAAVEGRTHDAAGLAAYLPSNCP